MELLNALSSLLTLMGLEIILGIDNVIFLSVVLDRLPTNQRRRARYWGLMLAWISRFVLLASAVWLTQLNHPFWTYQRFSVSPRNIFLFLGGIFLMTKAIQEIRDAVGESHLQDVQSKRRPLSLKKGILQIAIMDVVFSLDSVLTAVGLTNHFWIMFVAITAAIFAMLFASASISRFIERYPTFKILALSFLILIGTLLVAEGFSVHLPRGYIYFAMGFAFTIECLNVLKGIRKKS
ncbi:MAG: TerC family protein [Legionella sp.]|nr:TerC family protein [Legionella sp.]